MSLFTTMVAFDFAAVVVAAEVVVVEVVVVDMFESTFITKLTISFVLPIEADSLGLGLVEKVRRPRHSSPRAVRHSEVLREINEFLNQLVVL